MLATNRNGDDRTITANVEEVLVALRTNLEEHQEIVAEATIGYRRKCAAAVLKAQEKLQKRWGKIEDGEKFEMGSIHFNEALPDNHSREFNTIIKMLELHLAAHEGQMEARHGTDPKTPATIELKAIDVQRFVLNDWDWMNNFLLSNSSYSAKSMELASSKGLV